MATFSASSLLFLFKIQIDKWIVSDINLDFRFSVKSVPFNWVVSGQKREEKKKRETNEYQKVVLKVVNIPSSPLQNNGIETIES